jgi:amino acid transporter
MADTAVPAAQPAIPNSTAGGDKTSSPPRRYVSTTQAAFIGVASMVGAGIFSLLGAAGAVAGAAVWLSFLLAGTIAALQGYSFAKLGAKFPSAGGMLEYINQSFGYGHVSTVAAWLGYSVNAIITAMVAVSFGSYASSAFTNNDPNAAKGFAILLVGVMTLLNIAGSTIVARVQSVIVFIVVGILGLFAVVTILNVHPGYLDPAGYPSIQKIVSSVALTFFAFLGFGVVTFTAKDLANPARQLAGAVTIAITIAMVVYVAVALGVFGTLTVPQVIQYGPTAIAEAARPVLGDLGFLLITVTALFATTGATNSGLYPMPGIAQHLHSTGQFPAFMARNLWGRASVGLLVAAVAVVLMILVLNLDAIASIGSAVALAVFSLISIGHVIIRRQTGANIGLLILGLLTALIALITFVFTEVINEPATIATLVLIFVASVVFDILWSRPVAKRASDA